MSSITVTLTAQNLGPDADESFFDDWAGYLNEHIDEATGLDVSVGQFAFTGRNSGGDEDVISGATDEQRETIRDAIATLWEQGCAENFGKPRSAD